MAWGIGGWLVMNFKQKVGPALVAKLKERIESELRTTFLSKYSNEISRGNLLSESGEAEHRHSLRVRGGTPAHSFYALPTMRVELKPTLITAAGLRAQYSGIGEAALLCPGARHRARPCPIRSTRVANAPLCVAIF
jgi:hypothetical protein